MRGRQSRPLAAHHQQGRQAVAHGAEILARLEVRADTIAPPGCGPGREALRADAGQRHVEDRAHAGAHRLVRIGIAAGADQHDAAGAHGIGGADDGAEVARIAHALQRHPHGIVGHGLRRRLGRPALLEHAEHGLRVVLGGELAEHGLRHLQALGPCRLRPLHEPAGDPGCGAAGQEGQHLRHPAGVARGHQHARRPRRRTAPSRAAPCASPASGSASPARSAGW